MDKNYLIQLTNKLYRLTLLFPKKEPLRYKMREIANEILADIVAEKENLHRGKKPTIVGILPRLETLDSFFEVAKAQNWVKAEEILNLQQEYSKVKQEYSKGKEKIHLVRSREREIPPEPTSSLLTSDVNRDVNRQPQASLNDRHRTILDFLKENGQAQVGHLTKVLSQVTKRTLRRDFKDLLNQGLIERMGDKNETYYRLK